MVFPETLTITAIDSATGQPIAAVALLLELRARRKNNYSVGPVITDHNGNASFTKGACENGIARDQQMFVMDYSGDLLSCGPEAVIQLHNPESIARMIHNYEQFPKFWGNRFDDPEHFFAELGNTRNATYEPSNLTVREKDILERPAVSFYRRRK